MIEILPGLFGLVFASAVTPGPNNLIILSVTVAEGPRQAGIAASGILLGTAGLLSANWFGAVALFELWPSLQLVLVTAGASYLVWSGITLCRGPPQGDADAARPALPSSLMGLTGFQFTNPKGWVLCLSAISAIQVHAAGPIGLLILLGIFAATLTVSLGLWIGLAHALSGVRDKTSGVWISRGLGGLLIVSSCWLFISAV